MLPSSLYLIVCDPAAIACTDCFCVLKVFLKKIKFFLFFYLL
jgi:hypothetical protein